MLVWPLSTASLRAWRAGVGIFGALVLVAVLALGVIALPGNAGRGRARAPAAMRHGGGASLPLAAQGAVSRVLGGVEPGDRAVRVGAAAALTNSRQRLHVWFDRRGAMIHADGARLGLTLRAWGHGARLRPLGAVAPRARANEVVYQRGGLAEWYANGPLGLEQGFTVAARPTGRRGWLTLSL